MAEITDNRFIAALSAEDRRAIEPLLRPTEVALGQVVIEQDGVVEDIHFPVDAQFANQTRFPDGDAVETAIVGCEGITGLAPFMSSRTCAWEVTARAPGRAYAARALSLRAVAAQRPSLMLKLLELVDFYQAQAAQNAACNATHHAQPRLARWLLTAHDLSKTDQVAATQEELARMLGKQRTTVNEAAASLKASGLISYSRGRIRIVDRKGLEGAACSCYGMLSSRFGRLMSPSE